MSPASALAVMPDSPERVKLITYFRDCSYNPIVVLSQTPADIGAIAQPDVAVIDLSLPNSRTLVDFMMGKSPDIIILGVPPPQDTQQIPGMFLHKQDLPLDYELNLLLAVVRVINNPYY